MKIDEQTASVLWDECVIGLAEVSREGVFLRVNPALCRLLEYTEVELLNRKFQEITHPSDMHDDVEMTKKVFNGDLPEYVMHKRYITKTGTVIWVKLKVVGVRFTDGSFHLFLSQISPMVELESIRKEVKDALDGQVTFSDIEIGLFAKKHWKWIAGIVIALFGFLFKEYYSYRAAQDAVARNEKHVERLEKQIHELTRKGK